MQCIFLQKAAVDRSVDNERAKIMDKLKVPWQDMNELRHDVMHEERFVMLKRMLVVKISATAETFPRIGLETLFSGYLIGRVYFDWPSQYVFCKVFVTTLFIKNEQCAISVSRRTAPWLHTGRSTG